MPWVIAAGALLGTGAHFANVLPDLEDDRRTGVRGLGHRIGRIPSILVTWIAFAGADVVLAVGLAFSPIAIVGLVVGMAVAAIGIVLAADPGTDALAIPPGHPRRAGGRGASGAVRPRDPRLIRISHSSGYDATDPRTPGSVASDPGPSGSCRGFRMPANEVTAPASISTAVTIKYAVKSVQIEGPAHDQPEHRDRDQSGDPGDRVVDSRGDATSRRFDRSEDCRGQWSDRDRQAESEQQDAREQLLQ